MWITDGITNKKINKNGFIPKDWTKGRTIKYTNQKFLKGKESHQYGTIWITNGIETKKIQKDDNIPNGWNRGRKIQ